MRLDGYRRVLPQLQKASAAWSNLVAHTTLAAWLLLGYYLCITGCASTPRSAARTTVPTQEVNEEPPPQQSIQEDPWPHEFFAEGWYWERKRDAFFVTFLEREGRRCALCGYLAPGEVCTECDGPGARAFAVARETMRSKDWQLLGPSRILEAGDCWIVETNTMGLGMNARIEIDKEAFEVRSAEWNPR